ncbi:YccF domain-containing protein [Candidatus Galacturonibacter soehngenii]|uniref:YccF domain-containing protein n=1 Tax=Candidatus Galacturonatibacter soehngenii TaxID=2307010 RepID=A0A7V7UCQ9_9FIRM|nr:YccF domain-containing protein [Candidatus Galacturonibacter soehngenii]KAB1439622.1 YccF domain-containing protein [Candidatus Galacturonibacter soehngenii]MBA4688991.1 YccF domain-containing protein [Candidatus Galacturonibacter soehngenii]
MGCLGNIIWCICGGFLSCISWLLIGVLWCITIVGIPIGLQCFKIAGLVLFPFGQEVEYGGGVGSFLLNLLWIIFSGVPLALESLLMGLLCCITIIGIPFGLQHFKIAKLALMPFGSRVG